jgi:hypothetical protein
MKDITWQQWVASICMILSIITEKDSFSIYLILLAIYFVLTSPKK